MIFKNNLRSHSVDFVSNTFEASLIPVIVQLKESQLLQMNSRQAELESRVLETTRLYENERESAKNQEQLLRGKISQLSSENAQLLGDKTGRMVLQRDQIYMYSSFD